MPKLFIFGSFSSCYLSLEQELSTPNDGLDLPLGFPSLSTRAAPLNLKIFIKTKDK